MSIWGKVLGGAAGFAIGGPLGALLGAVAGHAVDQFRDQQTEQQPSDATKQIGFTIGVIVLSAKMAKADGRVTRDEIRAFREKFHIPPDEEKNVARLFDRAKRDARGFEPYAEQIARLLRDAPTVREELLDCLFHIAKADGEVHPEELRYLEKVAAIFGFDAETFARIRAGHTGPDAGDPYTVLGIDRSASDDEIRRRYRELIREHHPDRLMAQGLPKEFEEVANQKMAAINAAYDQIEKQRGL